MYDIAIIGGGPAGATLARLIGKKYKVLLIDKRKLDTDAKDCSVVKCCGGLVAPDAQKVLAELGLGLPQKVLVGPQIFVVRTIDFKQDMERYYQRFYINIDREKFDSWLLGLVSGSVDVRCGCIFKSFERSGNHFKIKFTDNGRDYFENARILVGADGAYSIVRNQAFPDSRLPIRYISIQEWFEAGKIFPYFSAIFDEDITDFYSWTIPKDNYLLVGSALQPGNDAAKRFEILKEKLSHYGFTLNKCVKREGAHVLRPQSLKQMCTGQDNIALLGEAAGWISPSSAEGFSYAFRSAIALARSLEAGTEGFVKRYERNALSLKNNILVKNLKSPFMYNNFMRRLAMGSGFQSLDIQENEQI